MSGDTGDFEDTKWNIRVALRRLNGGENFVGSVVELTLAFFSFYAVVKNGANA